MFQPCALFFHSIQSNFRACLHGGGGPQVGEVTRLAVVEKWPAFTCTLKTPGSRGDVTRHCCKCYPTLSRLHGKMRPRLTGLPYLADRATRLGGLPHLSCKHDEIKMRDYMERRVTPHRRVTSPTWGPPPPCKQALKQAKRLAYLLEVKISDQDHRHFKKLTSRFSIPGKIENTCLSVSWL